MILEIAMHIVDHDPIAVARRSIDTRQYTQLVWSQSYLEPIDEEQLCRGISVDTNTANKADLGRFRGHL